MIIDIDKLSESELIDLNNRIVERLRFFRHARAHATMLRYRIGERVYFEPDGHGQLSGVVTRYNKKSVTVVTDAGERWNVSPGLLSAESIHDGQSRGGTVPQPGPTSGVGHRDHGRISFRHLAAAEPVARGLLISAANAACSVEGSLLAFPVESMRLAVCETAAEIRNASLFI